MLRSWLAAVDELADHSSWPSWISTTPDCSWLPLTGSPLTSSRPIGEPCVLGLVAPSSEGEMGALLVELLKIPLSCVLTGGQTSAR